MGLSGEDKRIRALFRELKREDDRITPSLAKTWRIAEAKFHRRGFSRLRFQSSSNLLRFATAILVVSLILVATVLLSRYFLTRRQPMRGYETQQAAAVPRATSEEPLRSGRVPANRESAKPTDRLVAVRRSVRVKKLQIESVQRAGAVKQNGLSEWQSPTAKLLRSAGDELLRFVPQMNESAEEMKKFLAIELN